TLILFVKKAFVMLPLELESCSGHGSATRLKGATPNRPAPRQPQANLCHMYAPPLLSFYLLLPQRPGTLRLVQQEALSTIHLVFRGCTFTHVCSVSFSYIFIAGLADGTLGFFSPTPGGWDLSSHAVMSLGSTPLQPIRCCLAKAGRMWVGYWNKVHVVDIENRKTELVFTVSERSEQQVRFLCAGGSGVWTACRLDPILRLYDWTTGRPLQEVDFSALILKTLGPSFLTLSPLQISSLSIICGRLWIGTGGGAVISIPLSIIMHESKLYIFPASEAVSIPYCSIASTQLCYHGHRQAVRFIIPAPSCLMTSSDNTTVTPSQLIISGGEGYINFRIGDDANEESDEAIQSSPQRSERSLMIIWQISSATVPNPAL
uniref:Uncharacterized protein n=1 Tax=Periophthalmus magnuspinnatus TaxID=409849 RepID=A0A3B4BJ48_9GOBI